MGGSWSHPTQRLSKQTGSYFPGSSSRDGEDDRMGRWSRGHSDSFILRKLSARYRPDEGRVEEVVVETLAPLYCPFQAHTQIRGVGQNRIALLVLFFDVCIDVLGRRRERM